MQDRWNRSGSVLGLALDPLTHSWANAQFGAGSGTDLGQLGASGSLINQAPAFEASANSLGAKQPDLPSAGAPPPGSGVQEVTGA